MSVSMGEKNQEIDTSFRCFRGRVYGVLCLLLGLKFNESKFRYSFKVTSDYIMMGKLLLLPSYKEKIIGTKTNLLLQAMLKITFTTTVAIMWWKSVGVLM